MTVYYEKPFSQKQLNDIKKVRKLLKKLQNDGIRIEGRQDLLVFWVAENYEAVFKYSSRKRLRGGVFGNYGEIVQREHIPIADSGADDTIHYPEYWEIIRKRGKIEKAL